MAIRVNFNVASCGWAFLSFLFPPSESQCNTRVARISWRAWLARVFPAYGLRREIRPPVQCGDAAPDERRAPVVICGRRKNAPLIRATGYSAAARATGAGS